MSSPIQVGENSIEDAKLNPEPDQRRQIAASAGVDQLLRTGYIRLSTKGRLTGLPHIVQLRYTWMNGSFHAISGSPSSDWVLNLIKRPLAVVRISDFLYEVTAEVLGGQGADSVKDQFRRKYGRSLVERWYSKSQMVVRLTPTGTCVKRGGSAGELGARSTFGHWKKTRAGGYYDAVARAFDSAAEEYDFTISHNYINTWIRRRSIEVLLSRVEPDDFLLEVGCGTGAESVEIARHVRGLIALDISQAMVELLSAKVRARGLEGRILPLRLAASDLPKVRSVLAGRKIRVAYSFNGALNCEPRISEFVSHLADLLEPGGTFICSVRNTLCLTEAFAHAAVLQYARMSPRKRQPTMVSVGGRDIPSSYYSTRDFAEIFGERFKTEEMIALPGLLPPAYLNDYYLRLGSLTNIVERLDRVLSRVFPLNRYGDQTLFVFRKIA